VPAPNASGVHKMEPEIDKDLSAKGELAGASESNTVVSKHLTTVWREVH